MAECAKFPKFALWNELNHEFVRQYVDDRHGGDWAAYLTKLEGYERQLKGIHDKGLGAVITWRANKVRLKGARLAEFLKLVEQRLKITRCLADNESLAEFTTAAGGTDLGDEADPPKPRQCEQIPQVAWWKFSTHESVANYVSQRHRGNWRTYIDKWSQRLAKLQEIYGRGSSAVTNTGIVLKGHKLSAYIGQMQKRISVVSCLAKNSGDTNV